MKLYCLILVALVAGCSPQSSKKNYFGYETMSLFHMDDLGSDVQELVHKKSGAKLVLIKNKDQARTFSITFRTPPYDDTGLFHIFEHAVLAGSRNYPSKSNFFNLANSSVASYINAGTGSVYTRYPIVSRSLKDFDNLMNNYMDAVFFPNTVKDPRIVQREGWHYEVDPQTKKMSINGIVLSEMKGVYSSPYRVLFSELDRNMIPQTPYSYISGGLPAKIATLSFDQIKEAHKKYYHPQNSIIYLYGDLDYTKILGTLHSQYLIHFKKDPNFKTPEIPLQKDFSYEPKLVTSTYPGSPAPNKDFLTKAYILGEEMSDLDENAASILISAFVDNVAAPLKLRSFKDKLAKSTFSSTFGEENNGVAFVFEGTEEIQKDKIEKTINEELTKVVEQGLDSSLITSILNSYEFSYKEANNNGSHRGLQLSGIINNNWLYPDKSLKEDLDIVSIFKKLRITLKDQNYIKSFFKKYFLDNKKTRWLLLKPDAQFSEKFNAQLESHIESALQKKSIEEYEKEFQSYKKWVAEKESQEILGKTPTLQLSDIKSDEPAEKFVISKSANTRFIEYPQDTSGIGYIQMFFDLKGVKEADIKKLDLLTSFLQQTDTTKMGFKEISTQIDTFTGGFGFGVGTYQSAKDPNKFRPSMTMTLKFLKENKDKAFELALEVMTQSQFTPHDRVNDLLAEIKNDMTASVASRAPGLSMAAATRHFFPKISGFRSELGGDQFEKYILKESIEAKSLVPELKKLLGDIFNQKRLYLSTITAESKNLSLYKMAVEKFKSQLPAEGGEDQEWSFANQEKFEAYAIPGEVQYVSMATSFRDQGLEYDGSMRVYAKYLNNNYMTPRLREQAGAYGGWSSFSRSGIYSLSTYRDPNLKRSLDTFSQSVEFMKNEELSPKKIEPAILGSLKPYYSDKSVFDRTSLLTALHMTDQTWEDYLKIKQEVLMTTPEKLKDIASKLAPAMKKAKTAVSGNPRKLKAEAPFLKKVMSLQ